ncbi:MAG: hypothetical protein ACKPAD_05565, partial [Bacteroidota bacterium]
MVDWSDCSFAAGPHGFSMTHCNLFELDTMASISSFRCNCCMDIFPSQGLALFSIVIISDK